MSFKKPVLNTNANNSIKSYQKALKSKQNYISTVDKQKLRQDVIDWIFSQDSYHSKKIFTIENPLTIKLIIRLVTEFNHDKRISFAFNHAKENMPMEYIFPTNNADINEDYTIINFFNFSSNLVETKNINSTFIKKLSFFSVNNQPPFENLSINLELFNDKNMFLQMINLIDKECFTSFPNVEVNKLKTGVIKLPDKVKIPKIIELDKEEIIEEKKSLLSLKNQMEEEKELTPQYYYIGEILLFFFEQIVMVRYLIYLDSQIIASFKISPKDFSHFFTDCQNSLSFLVDNIGKKGEKMFDSIDFKKLYDSVNKNEEIIDLIKYKNKKESSGFKCYYTNIRNSNHTKKKPLFDVSDNVKFKSSVIQHIRKGIEWFFESLYSISIRRIYTIESFMSQSLFNEINRLYQEKIIADLLEDEDFQPTKNKKGKGKGKGKMKSNKKEEKEEIEIKQVISNIDKDKNDKNKNVNGNKVLVSKQSKTNEINQKSNINSNLINQEINKDSISNNKKNDDNYNRLKINSENNKICEELFGDKLQPVISINNNIVNNENNDKIENIDIIDNKHKDYENYDNNDNLIINRKYNNNNNNSDKDKDDKSNIILNKSSKLDNQTDKLSSSSIKLNNQVDNVVLSKIENQSSNNSFMVMSKIMSFNFCDDLDNDQMNFNLTDNNEINDFSTISSFVKTKMQNDNNENEDEQIDFDRENKFSAINTRDVVEGENKINKMGNPNSFNTKTDKKGKPIKQKFFLYDTSKLNKKNLNTRSINVVSHSKSLIKNFPKFDESRTPFIYMQRLHNDIIDFSLKVIENNSIVRSLKIEVLEKLKHEFHSNNENIENVICYGSFATDLSIEYSDVDLRLVFNEKVDMFKEVNDFILYCQSNEIYKNIKPITSASIPIIKIEIDLLNYKSENRQIQEKLDKLKLLDSKEIYEELKTLKIDITFSKTNSSETMEVLDSISFVQKYCVKFPEIVPMMFILKHYLNKCDKNSAYKGFISSYCLFLLLLAFKLFQINNVKKDVTYNLGNFLYEFLDFYGNSFSFIKYKVDINTGGK